MSASSRFVPAFTALAIALGAAPAFAQKAAPAPAPDYEKELGALVGISGGLTADQAAERAAKVSPDVRRKIAELGSARALVDQAKVLRIPRLDGTLRYTRLSPVTLMPPLDTIIKIIPNQWNADAQLSVPISDYFVRIPYVVDVADASVVMVHLGEQTAALNAALEARVAYYEWARARLQVVVAERLVAQVGATVEQLSALVSVQRASRADLLRLQAQKAQADLALVQTKDALAIREEQLRILIGAEPEEQLAIGEDVRGDVPIPALGKPDDLAREALGRRLETKIIAANEDLLTRTAQSQKADRYPRLSAFAQANYDKPNQRAFGSSDLELTWAVGAQITWSPNDMLLADTKIDDTEAKIRALGADRQRLADGIRAEVTSYVQQVDIARQALINTQQALAAAEESYRVRRELLDAERVTAVELVDAETELTRARIAAIDARIDLRIALARLAHALGQDVQ
ncbi:MAG TPA: TolC family protein [Kofleriaceae bacterium]|nr:TolC family protein [Kofleriaceae bacterium]